MNGRVRGEPSQLVRGKRFHARIQAEWQADVTDIPLHVEHTMYRKSGRRGRMDVCLDEGSDWVSVIEIKAMDWDRMTPANVRRNVRRQIRQIWSYVETYVDLEGRSVCAGIIFPDRPRDLKRTELIEQMFNHEGIQVVWHSESMAELKVRMSGRGD